MIGECFDTRQMRRNQFYNYPNISVLCCDTWQGEIVFRTTLVLTPFYFPLYLKCISTLELNYDYLRFIILHLSFYILVQKQ